MGHHSTFRILSFTANIRTGPNVIKLFVRYLQIFVLSSSVCPWEAYPSLSNKHSSLVRKCVSYGQRLFYNIGPRIKATDNDKQSSLLPYRVNLA
jgi:hypothetical protein